MVDVDMESSGSGYDVLSRVGSPNMRGIRALVDGVSLLHADMADRMAARGSVASGVIVVMVVLVVLVSRQDGRGSVSIRRR